jgi:uncharacterized membrane protein YjjP (DUF1212 family)
MLISPALALGFILATLYGAAFHFLVGGDARRLAFFLIAGWVGFLLGQYVGTAFGITLLSIGALHVFAGTLGSLLALIAARILSGRPQFESN